MYINLILLIALVGAALWTVMSRSLLRCAIGLALTSVILTIIMFRLNSPLAAVFELSVCAGLISVLFVSTISLTHPLSNEQVVQDMKSRFARFWFLPVVVIGLGLYLGLGKIKLVSGLPVADSVQDVRVVLWNLRHVDMMGQIIILLMGVFGVVILFKERLKK